MQLMKCMNKCVTCIYIYITVYSVHVESMLLIMMYIFTFFLEWSRQSLLDSWMKDPVVCCKDAGVPPPSSAINFSTTQDSLKLCCEQIQNEYQNETLNSPARTVIIKEEVMVIKYLSIYFFK